MPEYRFNDRGVQRALADNEAAAYEFLVANGVTFADRPPGVQGGHAIGISAPRENYAEWDKGQSLESPRGGGGTVVYRALENSAKRKGVRFLLNDHMDAVLRETPSSGRVLGIKASYKPQNFLDAALAPNEGSQAPDFAAGPTWAIFDADAVRREKWDLTPPSTDPLSFFSAGTLADLSRELRRNPYQKVEMPANNLDATVARYNTIVDFGVDPDFDKPNPKHKIRTPPFYAAWASPVVHDTYAGLRINMKCQVMDFNGQIIPGLYSGGESAGGCSQHGQGRAITQGYIAGKEAAGEKSST
jgi:hypothetical protein